MAARVVKKKASAPKRAGTGRGSSVKAVLDEARKVGGRIAHAVAETPEFVQARRNDRALRSELDFHCREIGRRALALHKRSRGESPFARFKTIMKELDALTEIENEYRANRVRLSELRQEIRGTTKS